MSDPSLPPPPYEFSQQELDRKVTRAIEASINQPAPAPTSDDDFVYSEAAFEAAFEAAVKMNQTRSQESSSSSSSSRLPPAPQPSGSSPAIPPTNVQPLRINKRTSAPPTTIVTPPAQKERPSWLDRAEGGSSSSARVSPPSSNTTQGTLSSASGSSRLSPNTIEEDEEEDLSVPPPSFAAAIASSPQGSTLNVVSPYHGDGSNPPSPLASPTPSNTVLPTQQHQDFELPNPHETLSTGSHFPVSHSQLPNPHPHLPGPSHPNRASLPPPPAMVVPRRIVRPGSVAYTSTTPKAVVHQPPQMEFDARSVYNRPTRTQPMQGVNAASFYNSAVSAHMTPTSCVSRTNNPNNRRSEYFAAGTPQQQQPQQFYFQQQQPMYDPQQPYAQQQNPYVQQPSYGMYQPSPAQPMAGYGQQQQFSGVQSGWSS